MHTRRLVRRTCSPVRGFHYPWSLLKRVSPRRRRAGRERPSLERKFRISCDDEHVKISSNQSTTPKAALIALSNWSRGCQRSDNCAQPGLFSRQGPRAWNNLSFALTLVASRGTIRLLTNQRPIDLKIHRSERRWHGSTAACMDCRSIYWASFSFSFIWEREGNVGVSHIVLSIAGRGCALRFVRLYQVAS